MSKDGDLACPFCRCQPRIDQFDDPRTGLEFFYRCFNGCKAIGPVAKTPEEALSLWNRRNGVFLETLTKKVAHG